MRKVVKGIGLVGGKCVNLEDYFGDIVGRIVEVSWDAPDPAPVHACNEWLWRTVKAMSVPFKGLYDGRWYWHESPVFCCPWCGEKLP